MAKLSSIHRQSEEYIASGELDAARRLLEAILRKLPGHVDTLLRLSYVESLDGHYRRARTLAVDAATHEPADPGNAEELLRRLRSFNEVEALRGYLARLPPPERLPIPLLLVIAAQLSYLNRQEDALAFLDEAMRADPGYPPTLVSRGQVLTYLGRFDEAARDLERCVSIAPGTASAWWALSRLRKQSPERNHVDRLRKAIDASPVQGEAEAMLAYALHKELDDIGDYEAAAALLSRACRAKRTQVDYSTAGSQALFDALLRLPAEGAPTATTSAAGAPIPVFVVGMHRSGTTLLEQLLASHTTVQGLGELYDFTSAMRWATDHHCRGVIDATIVDRAAGADFAAAGQRYMHGLRWRLDGSSTHFVDKLPSNFLNIDFICRALPNARILHMRRDPVETCFSNLRELFSEANPWSYEQRELAEYFLLYRKLMRHWHERWPGRILDVEYARLVANTGDALGEICAFIGLSYEPSMLARGAARAGVATASAVQVRGAIAAPDRPKWLPYRDYLQPMIRALAE